MYAKTEIYMMSVDSEFTVFIDKALSKIIEILCWLVSPPVHQVAVLVILSTCSSQQLFTHTINGQSHSVSQKTLNSEHHLDRQSPTVMVSGQKNVKW